ncbi:MAG: ATP-binding protein [Deltaproteobacteria bacterium]|nr:ATP-binding protein [Deltaproteobacteria bacterium]
MQTYIKRILTTTIKQKLENMPGVVILGPRQCGKSTLAKAIISEIGGAVHLDLERPSEVSKLRDPEAFFSLNNDKLICLDEIQRVPDLFPVLRSVMDENRKNGQFIILGSASPDLIKQSSETLAGRISYFELTPFLLKEVSEDHHLKTLRKLWLRGGFPRSYLASDEKESIEWRLDFIRTFLERDIPQLGFRTPAKTIERFWRICAHLHGQLLNSSKLGESMGVSHHTVRSYIDMLEQSFVLRVLRPYESNLKKRLIKSPKIYIRDSGILHALLGIETHNDLLGHPVYGASWEGMVIENILSLLPNWKASFYRTSSGSEIDLILEKGNKHVAIECKGSTAPNLSRGFWNTVSELELKEVWVVAPVKEAYPIEKGVMVAPPLHLIEHLMAKER